MMKVLSTKIQSNNPLDNSTYTKAQLRKLITDATLSDTGNMYQIMFGLSNPYFL